MTEEGHLSAGAGRIACVACSVFRGELDALRGRGQVDFPVSFLDSSLHMKPSALRGELERMVDELRSDGAKVLLVYGDCHPYMREMSKREGVRKVEGVSCVEILLGREARRKYLKERAFMLFPEWIGRWRELLTDELAGQGDSVRMMLRESHDKFIYLDTGTRPPPYDELRACAEFFGIPYETLRVDLGTLLGKIRAAAAQLQERV